MERGGAVTVDQVAHELNTTPAVVAGMLEHMAHTGWVRDLAISCDQRCTECVFVRDCTHFKRGRVWQVNG
jgi:hypothetical protein